MTSQDLLPPEADVDLDYLHQCLVVISAILFNSSEDQKLSLKARVGLSEALVNTIVAGSALVLTLDDSRTQAGTYATV